MPLRCPQFADLFSPFGLNQGADSYAEVAKVAARRSRKQNGTARPACPGQREKRRKGERDTGQTVSRERSSRRARTLTNSSAKATADELPGAELSSRSPFCFAASR